MGIRLCELVRPMHVQRFGVRVWLRETLGFSRTVTSRLMEQTKAYDYFMNVAYRYDGLYGFMYEELSRLAVKHLQLKPNDLLADVGAGTGGISHLIWKKAGLFCNSTV